MRDDKDALSGARNLNARVKRCVISLAAPLSLIMNDYIAMSEEMMAARECADRATIIRLLEQGEAPDAENEDSRESLLGWAAWRGFTDVVRVLLDKGADIDAQGHDGDTPLICAASEGRLDIVRLLIERGADLNMEQMGGWTALKWARLKGCKEIARILLEAGAFEDVSA